MAYKKIVNKLSGNIFSCRGPRGESPPHFLANNVFSGFS